MASEEAINRALNEVQKQYEKALQQLYGLNNTIRDLRTYANHLIDTGDFSAAPKRLSNEAWRKRATEMIKELIKIDKANYPSFNSVLVPIYIELRNVYGIVLEQLRKDFRSNNDTLRYPSAFEAISDDDVVRDIFDSLLISLFPKDYFNDDVLEFIKDKHSNNTSLCDTPEEIVLKIIAPLAIKKNDDSKGFSQTFEFVCAHMNCDWKNLQTRYRNKYKISDPPSRMSIITDSTNVLNKFKKTVRSLLEDCG